MNIILIFLCIIVLYQLFSFSRLRYEYKNHVCYVQHMVLLRDVVTRMNNNLEQEKYYMETLVEMKKIIKESKEILLQFKDFHCFYADKEIKNLTEYAHKKTILIVSTFEDKLKKVSGF